MTMILLSQASLLLCHVLFLLLSLLFPHSVLSNDQRKENESSAMFSESKKRATSLGDSSSCLSCGKIPFVRWLFHLQPLEQKLKSAEERLKAHQGSFKRLKTKGKGTFHRERELLLKQYITLLRSAILAKEAAAQATAEYLQQTSLNIDGDQISLIDSDSSVSSEQMDSLRLLRRMQNEKEYEAAARREVAAMERSL